VAFKNVRPASIRVKPIEKPCQQDCARTVDSLKLRQVDIE